MTGKIKHFLQCYTKGDDGDASDDQNKTFFSAIIKNRIYVIPFLIIN